MESNKEPSVRGKLEQLFSAAPVYKYRGFHLDTARHFIDIEELKKNIRCAAAFHFNYFHFHFSDDQGYRIESKVLPELTRISSKRAGDTFGGCHSEVEEQHYYTQEEIKDLVRFAGEYGIEIVPEIDVPGHVTDILAAYPELSCSGRKVEVATSEGIYSDILCAGNEQVYTFLKTLLDELCELFPGKYFHIGGDETPKTAWKTCPKCQAKMKAEGLTDEHQLQGYMQNRIASYLKSKGKMVIAWNEAALGGNLDKDIVLQLWNDDPKDPALAAFNMKDENGNLTSPNQGIGAKHIKRGGNVITSNMLHSYCDYPHAFISARNIYEADMIPQKCEDIPDAREHVLGGEALCWTEHIRNAEQLEYQIWPRYAFKGINLYCGKPEESFEDFLKEYKDPIRSVIESFGIKPAPWEEVVPDQQTARKQMMEFMMRIGGAGAAEKFKKAQQEI